MAPALFGTNATTNLVFLSANAVFTRTWSSFKYLPIWLFVPGLLRIWWQHHLDGAWNLIWKKFPNGDRLADLKKFPKVFFFCNAYLESETWENMDCLNRNSIGWLFFPFLEISLSSLRGSLFYSLLVLLVVGTWRRFQFPVSCFVFWTSILQILRLESAYMTQYFHGIFLHNLLSAVCRGSFGWVMDRPCVIIYGYIWHQAVTCSKCYLTSY